MELKRNNLFKFTSFWSFILMFAFLSSCTIAGKLDSKHVYYKTEKPDFQVKERVKPESKTAELAMEQPARSVQMKTESEPAPVKAGTITKLPDFTIALGETNTSNEHPAMSDAQINQMIGDHLLSYGSSAYVAKDVQDLTLVELILAILLPPLAVALAYGLETEFWIALILTILGWIPGVIYAIIVLAQD